MDKDLEEECSKKRKKLDTQEMNGKTSDDGATKVGDNLEIDKKNNSIPIYQRVTAYEENEALTRDPKADLNMYRETCGEFSTFINEIADLKLNKPEGWEEQVLEKKVDAGLLTIVMKKLNRIEKIRNKTSRENVTKVRQQVDVLQLQLQNLMCEIQHLKKEVDKCLVFRSRPLGIDLVPVNEFYEHAPANISRPEVTKVDEHQLQLARLEWELKQRRDLSLLSNQLEEKKNSLSKSIQKKENDLESLTPLIRDVLTVTKPLQEKLGPPSLHTSSRNELAPLLPHPLYFLFVQASAYSEDFDKRICVDVVGDADKARLLKTVEIVDSSSNEESELEEISKTQKKEKKEKLELRRKKLLSKHPLSVIIKINFKDGSSISLEYFYLIKLNIMTVLPTLNLPTKLKSPTASTLLHNSNILTNLFPGDNGLESPNLANYYQLKDVSLENFDQKKFGWPYLWVQKIGGLDFGGTNSSQGKKIEPKQEIANTSIPFVTKEICRRLSSRIALVKQVMELENGNVIGPKDMKSVKLSCLLKNWDILSWNEYRKHPATAHLKDSQYVSQHDIFFKGTIVREQAKLSVFMSVKCNYPSSPPVCALQLEWNNNVWNASNSSDIKDIEREVNVYWKELVSERGWGHSLLVLQVHRIMVCLDIMLECTNPEQFSAEKKTFFHPFRGRNRVHPYKFIPMGEGVFVQR